MLRPLWPLSASARADAAASGDDFATAAVTRSVTSQGRLQDRHCQSGADFLVLARGRVVPVANVIIAGAREGCRAVGHAMMVGQHQPIPGDDRPGTSVIKADRGPLHPVEPVLVSLRSRIPVARSRQEICRRSTSLRRRKRRASSAERQDRRDEQAKAGREEVQTSRDSASLRPTPPTKRTTGRNAYSPFITLSHRLLEIHRLLRASPSRGASSGMKASRGMKLRRPIEGGLVIEVAELRGVFERRMTAELFAGAAVEADVVPEVIALEDVRGSAPSQRCFSDTNGLRIAAAISGCWLKTPSVSPMSCGRGARRHTLRPCRPDERGVAGLQ